MIPFLLAFQFLTILPLPRDLKLRDGDMARSVGYYPLVGGFLGLFSAAIYWAGMRWCGFPVALVASVVSVVVLSGALHVDGLADMCDGFYAGQTKEHILLIMKDSHSGVMAIVGIVCLLAFKLAFLATIPDQTRIQALILAPTLGRWSMCFLCAHSTYARQEGGKSGAFIGQVNTFDWVKGAVLAIAIAFWIGRGAGLTLLALATAFAWVFNRWVTHRIGGMTGDTLGACSEIVEVMILALLSIHPAVVL